MMNLLERLADKHPGADPLDFAPALLRIKETPTAPHAASDGWWRGRVWRWSELRRLSA